MLKPVIIGGNLIGPLPSPAQIRKRARLRSGALALGHPPHGTFARPSKS